MAIVHVGAFFLQVDREEPRRAFVEELMAQIGACVRYVVQRCIEEALDAEVTALLGREWYERRGAGGQGRTPARCNRCGSQYAHHFRRDGHYTRYLDTCWGRLRISVPQVECACNGAVPVPFKTLRPRQRVWDDTEGAIRERYGWGMSLRWIKEYLDGCLASSLGLRTLNQRVRQLSQLVAGWRKARLAVAPPVVRVDGIWVTLMTATGETKRDRLGRQRPVKQAQKVPLLAAQGVWPASGHQEIVSWVIGQAEDEASWEALLTQMYERGISPERGLCLLVGDGSAGLEQARRTVYWDVPFQRCVFHKLRNVWRAIVVPEELEAQEARAYKRKLIRSAASVWQAGDAKEARRRQQIFCRQWREEQPAVVATIRRDFAATLTFYAVQDTSASRGQLWPARRLRTTSPLEREFRAVRRRLSQAVILHSPSGLEALIHQLFVRRAASRSNALPRAWHLTLERALAQT